MLTRRPEHGDIIEYTNPMSNEKHRFTVDHVHGGICYTMPPGKRDKDGKCFIWRFADGTLNQLHTIIE